MKPCPNCKEQAQDQDTECPRCGVIFDKWVARAEGHTVTTSSSTEPTQLQERDRFQIPWIPIIFSLTIVVATAGAYFYLKNTILADPVVSSVKIADDLNVDPGKPDQIYIAYRHAVTAGDLEILKILTAKEARQSLEEAPNSVLAALKASMPAQDKIENISIENGRAILTLEGHTVEDKKMKGHAEAVVENGLWKILKVEWRYLH